MTETKPLVVITGVTGYLGSQTCLTFLQDGSYRVRGTVRSTSNASKMAALKNGFGEELFEQLELVEADLNDEASIIAACEGADYVVHTASPFHFKGDCVTPAVNGTNAVMKACTAHNVKICVVTSSCAAALAPAKEDRPVPPAMFDESYWSDPNRPEGLHDYMKSKTLAEKAAWDYQMEQKKINTNSFDLVTILPTFVIGPAPCGEGTSIGWMKALLDGSTKEIPRGQQGFVDVRDCALAHLRAIQIPEAKNKRFIVYNERVAKPKILEWLQPFNARGAKVPTKLGEGEDVGGDAVDNSRSKDVLKIEYTPMQKTVTDFAEQMLENGCI
jgi:dihydroflavonol-4-reductase